MNRVDSPQPGKLPSRFERVPAPWFEELPLGKMAFVDDQRILCGGLERVRVLSLSTRRIEATSPRQREWTESVCSVPGAEIGVSGHRDGMVCLWPLETMKRPRRLKGHEDRVADVAVDSSGTRLASASYDETVRLWRLPGGDPEAVLRHPEGHAVCAVQWAPDGSRIYSAGFYGPIFVGTPGRTSFWAHGRIATRL